MIIITDFSSINRKLHRMEQKAEFDKDEAEKAAQSYAWPSFAGSNGVTPLSPSQYNDLARDLMASVALDIGVKI